MDNENKHETVTAQKCPYCFRKNECMLLLSAGMSLCLGPFRDDQDRIDKLRADDDRKKKRPDMHPKRLKRHAELIAHRWNKYLFDGLEEVIDDG